MADDMAFSATDDMLQLSNSSRLSKDFSGKARLCTWGSMLWI
jgi:hypothetical protein